MRGHSLREVIQWLLSGAVERKSLVALLASPLVVFLWSALKMPWEPGFADSGRLGPIKLMLASIVILLVLILTFYIKPNPSGGEPVVKLPKAVTIFAGIAAAGFLALLVLMAYEKYGQKSLVVKWPGRVFTHDTVVGGTFRNVDFHRGKLALYVCTKVRHKALPESPFIDRCWLDQHPPDLEISDGLWQTSCRFGNEDCADMDVFNPKFDIIPLLVRRDVADDGLQPQVDRDPSILSIELGRNSAVSLIGPIFQVQRICTKHPLPHFTSIQGGLRNPAFARPPEIHYSLCSDAVISWESAPGATTTPWYEVYFDGKLVSRGNSTSLKMVDLLASKDVPLVQWQRGELLELKISHDPNVQQYRNMYLYWDPACLTSNPSTRPVSTGSL